MGDYSDFDVSMSLKRLVLEQLNGNSLWLTNYLATDNRSDCKTWIAPLPEKSCSKINGAVLVLLNKGHLIQMIIGCIGVVSQHTPTLLIKQTDAQYEQPRKENSTLDFLHTIFTEQ